MAKEKKMIFDIGPTIAYLPIHGGFYKVENCAVEEVSVEHIHSYNSICGRVEEHVLNQSEIFIRLRCGGPTTEIKSSEFKELTEYSTIELLTELEKRTEIKKLLSS